MESILCGTLMLYFASKVKASQTGGEGESEESKKPRCCMLTTGTYGDVRPFIHIARMLQDTCEVDALVPQIFSDLVRKDSEGTIRKVIGVTDHVEHLWKAYGSGLWTLVNSSLPVLECQYTRFADAFHLYVQKNGAPDLIVAHYHPFSYMLPFLCSKYGCKKGLVVSMYPIHFDPRLPLSKNSLPPMKHAFETSFKVSQRNFYRTRVQTCFKKKLSGDPIEANQLQTVYFFNEKICNIYEETPNVHVINTPVYQTVLLQAEPEWKGRVRQAKKRLRDVCLVCTSSGSHPSRKAQDGLINFLSDLQEEMVDFLFVVQPSLLLQDRVADLERRLSDDRTVVITDVCDHTVLFPFLKDTFDGRRVCVHQGGSGMAHISAEYKMFSLFVPFCDTDAFVWEDIWSRAGIGAPSGLSFGSLADRHDSQRVAARAAAQVVENEGSAAFADLSSRYDTFDVQKERFKEIVEDLPDLTPQFEDVGRAASSWFVSRRELVRDDHNRYTRHRLFLNSEKAVVALARPEVVVEGDLTFSENVFNPHGLRGGVDVACWKGCGNPNLQADVFLVALHWDASVKQGDYVKEVVKGASESGEPFVRIRLENGAVVVAANHDPFEITSKVLFARLLAVIAGLSRLAVHMVDTHVRKT